MTKLTELSRDELIREAQRLKGENEALQAMEELRRQVEWAREEAQREAKLGTWEYDPQNGDTWWSIGMWELLQLERKAQPPSWETYLELFHPEDKPSVESALATSLKRGTPYEFEVRLQPQAEAAQRWVNCRGGILSTENGSVRKLIGAITDVSRSKHKELEQQARNRVLDALLVGKPVSEVMELILEILEVLYPNHVSVILAWNNTTDQLSHVAQHGLPANWEAAFRAGIKRELPGSPWSDAIAEKDLAVAGNFEEGLWPHLFPPIQENNSIQAAWALPIKDSAGEILGTFCSFYPKPQEPKEEEIAFVRSLLSLASVAITYLTDAENLQEQARQSASLLRLSTELELATDYEQVVDLLQQEIQSVLGYPACWLYLYSEDRKKLRMVATRGRPGDQGNFEPIELDSDQDGFVKALSEAEDLWVIPDAQTHPITDKEMVKKLGNRLIVNMPIRILQTSLGVIGAGTFGEDAPPPPNPQQQSYWRQLAKHTGAALNRIQYLQALEQSKRELQAANEELEAKVTERTQELELSLRSLEHFSFLASHDLREPLRMIISYLQLLERRMGERLTGEERDFMDFAVNGARRMKELLNGILTYSRLDAQASNRSQVSLNEILDKVQQVLALSIEQSGTQLHIGELPTLTANSQQMLLLFQHLIENAITFNQSQPPEIHISAKLQGDSWLFVVQDNGIGFEEKDAERIFLMFERLHNREDYPGNGVGLAVCQQIVQVHGGTIWASSTPGEGSCFYFRLINA